MMKTLGGNTQTYRSLYSMVEQVRSNGLVIYGAGFWGKISWQIFNLFDVTPECFCDDDSDKQGTYLIQDNVKVPIISLDEAAAKYPSAVYFAAGTGKVKEKTARSAMLSRLRERGLISEYSGFHPVRYLFLLEGGLEALKHTDKAVSNGFQIENLKNIIIANNTGNCGSVYFNSLMDGHPNIVNIVALGANASLTDIYLKRLQYLEGEELVLETASQMSAYFISQYPDEVLYPTFGRLAYEFFVDQNAQPEKRIYIDSTKFLTELNYLLSGLGKVSFAVLMKAIYAAYANTIGKIFDPGQTYWMYFDRHETNYDVRETDKLFSSNDFERIEHWFIIREPVQCVFSTLRRKRKDGGEGTSIFWNLGRPEIYLKFFNGCLGLAWEKTEATKNKTVKIIRFEDAKRKTRATMQAVAKWMDIPFDESMLEATVNGIPVYYPSFGGREQGVISSSDTTAADRKDFSALMSSYDIFRLNMAFQDFKKAYGYDCDVPDYRDFSQDFLQELYKHPFRFEDALDAASAEAEKIGALYSEKYASKYMNYMKSKKRPICHEYIINLLIDYMTKGTHELITDVIWPQETEVEK